MSGSNTIIFIVCFIVILIAIIKIWKMRAHLIHMLEKEKIKNMLNDLSQKQNLPINQDPSKELVLQKNFKHLSNLGEDVSCEKCINGSIDIKGEKAQFSFGIYNYTLEETVSTGSNRNHFKPVSVKRPTYTQFYCIVHENLNLPRFYMRDENAIVDTVIKKVTDMQDINFEPDDKYSSAFILQGEIEKDVRDLFKPEIRTAFLELAGKGYSFDSDRDALVVYGNIPTEEEFLFLHKNMQAIVEKLLN